MKVLSSFSRWPGATLPNAVAYGAHIGKKFERETGKMKLVEKLLLGCGCLSIGLMLMAVSLSLPAAEVDASMPPVLDGFLPIVSKFIPTPTPTPADSPLPTPDSPLPVPTLTPTPTPDGNLYLPFVVQTR